MSEALWSPSDARRRATRMAAFVDTVSRQAPDVTDYPSLYRWSIEQPAAFWQTIWRELGVVASREAEQVVDDVNRMPGARWFEGARLNFAENLLRHALHGGDDSRDAIVGWNESGRHLRLSRAQLAAEVARVAAGLRNHGIRPGDRVAGFLPNIPQAIVAMLAATSLGATWSSCSPDFGVKGVLDRFGQIEPRVLFIADGYTYAGKPFDSLERARSITEAIPAIERVVVVPYLDPAPSLGRLDRACLWDDFGGADAPLSFEQLPFDHPLYIMYSSGTTGLPKCMVHSAGGTLLQHLKELALHTDVGDDDRIFYFTTCGWMMWNWLVSSLATGATVALYDGSPVKPHSAILMDFAEQERITVFGTSAKYLASLEKESVRPAESHDLSALRTILSTGSPLAHESFDYVYQQIKDDVQLSSISGGTDLISCFALGNPLASVHRGELQTRGLGMKVEVWDDGGRPMVGEKGELVCSQAFPSMPIGFWNDPDGSRYHDAYFDHFEGVWRHGDWAEITPRGGMIIHGRSDATLNPGGVRIGTAEIYRQVEQLDDVVESLVIGQQWQGDVRIVLFVRLRPDLVLDEALEAQIRKQVRTGASPHHVPRKIVQVADLPRTLSGKITELAVAHVVHGRSVENTDALANPEVLELFRDLPVLTRS